MKNIQVISGDQGEHGELFAATDDEFDLIFESGQNIAFMGKVLRRVPKVRLFAVMSRIFSRPVMPGVGIRVHGVLFHEAETNEGGDSLL